MKRKRTFVLQETERRGVKGDDIQTTWRLQPDTKPPWHSTSTDIFPVKPTSTLQHITDRRLSPYHLPTKGIWPIEYRKTTRALTWSFYVGRSYIQYIGCFLTQKVTRIHYYQWETRRLSMLRRRILWRWCLDIPSWWEVRFNKTLLKGITMSRIGVVPCQHFNQTNIWVEDTGTNLNLLLAVCRPKQELRLCDVTVTLSGDSLLFAQPQNQATRINRRFLSLLVPINHL